MFQNAVFKRIIAFCTVQRLSALLVSVVGATVGAYAPRGMSPIQWLGAAIAVFAAIAVAVIVHRWPANAKARAR